MTSSSGLVHQVVVAALFDCWHIMIMDGHLLSSFFVSHVLLSLRRSISQTITITVPILLYLKELLFNILYNALVIYAIICILLDLMSAGEVCCNDCRCWISEGRIREPRWRSCCNPLWTEVLKFSDVVVSMFSRDCKPSFPISSKKIGSSNRFVESSQSWRKLLVVVIKQFYDWIQSHILCNCITDLFQSLQDHPS